MLNIGRLTPGAADYYVVEIATAAEHYDTGHGESAGRWAGSLASSIGLNGEVRPEHFRAVLDGRHSISGERLVSRDSSRSHPDGRSQPQPFDSNRLEVTRAASRLRLTVGRIGRLIWAARSTFEALAPDWSLEEVAGDGRLNICASCRRRVGAQGRLAGAVRPASRQRDIVQTTEGESVERSTIHPDQHRENGTIPVVGGGPSRQLLVPVEEAGRILGVGRTTVYDLIARGLIRPVHIGRLCRIPVDELNEFVSRLRTQESPKAIDPHSSNGADELSRF